jgi:outer membrane protein OmpA-like peptidoglycan-associated protein
MSIDEVIKPSLVELPNRINFMAEPNSKPLAKGNLSQEALSSEDRVIKETQPVNQPVKKITLRNLFNSDNQSLSAAGVQALSELCKQEKNADWSKLDILGFTDNVETTLGMNLVVARARANAVSLYFSDKRCFSFPIQIQGLGSARPVADNRTQLGRELNNRVELHFSVGK